MYCPNCGSKGFNTECARCHSDTGHKPLPPAGKARVLRNLKAFLYHKERLTTIQRSEEAAIRSRFFAAVASLAVIAALIVWFFMFAP